jgi:hypothetical protein
LHPRLPELPFPPIVTVPCKWAVGLLTVSRQPTISDKQKVNKPHIAILSIFILETDLSAKVIECTSVLPPRFPGLRLLPTPTTAKQRQPTDSLRLAATLLNISGRAVRSNEIRRTDS